MMMSGVPFGQWLVIHPSRLEYLSSEFPWVMPVLPSPVRSIAVLAIFTSLFEISTRNTEFLHKPSRLSRCGLPGLVPSMALRRLYLNAAVAKPPLPPAGSLRAGSLR